MELSEFNYTEDTKSLPGTKNTNQAELNIQRTCQGSICKMGVIKLSVKDYMSNLHTYIEKSSARLDGTVTTAPSASKSISEMLKICEADPVDLLIDLGFGIDEPDICNKIPSRFMMTPSEARGINIRVFLEAQKRRMEIEYPNLCGRFRQLEVLEQVTSAFSSLLKDVHNVKNGEDPKANSVKTSTLTQEKRNRIRQLLWKVFRQSKIVNENQSPCILKAEPNEKQDHHEPLQDTSDLTVYRKRRHSKEETSLAVLSKDQLPDEDDGDALPQRQEIQLCTLSTPVKQYNPPDMTAKVRTLKVSKVLSKTFQKRIAAHRLQTPESFEIEEVQSFEEDYPRAINQVGMSEITRTNSCQSDSSGFQEEPPEFLPLQSLHERSQSTDSQDTLREKNKYDSEEYDDVNHFTEPSETHENLALTSRNIGLQINSEKAESSAMNTENSDDVFEMFESHTDDVDKENMPEMDGQISAPMDTGNEAKEITDGASYLHQCGLDDQFSHQHMQTPEVSSEVDFPIYITHFLCDIRESNRETTGEINDNQLPDFSERCVSDLEKSDSDRGSFADDECSVELSNVTWTPSRMYDLESFNFPTQTSEGSVDYSDEELNHCYQDKQNTFQTEISTNIYKSVTIQMSSSLLPDSSERFNRHHSFYNTYTNRSEEHTMINYNAEQREAYSQTDVTWWNECRTNNHCSHERSCCLTKSLSFDTGLCGLNHSCPALSTHCHACHCHHCCIPRCHAMFRHNVSMRPSATLNLEKELSDTLKLLRESLINMSLNTDHDMENMKKACQHYREKLIEVEQCLIEQQAGCFNIFTSEEREKMRKLHMLRRNVLKEALELELNLDERARHVKETISMQLNQVLEEQSSLYSELEFSNWEEDSNSVEHFGNLYETHSAQSTSSSTFNAPKEHPECNQAEPGAQSQKMDFSNILQNIKKTFRSFNNT
ncbi:protein ITPRID1 [Mixophyes fleayi]|uniref:protein ITPRID1 n=1 Tax=Mixophyes fleayi TaxID=3061075 RepID=UPI003F4E127B